ncbi:MAG: hypothetical protein R2713_01855 [Ilumatobacteraceae bacterium]
MAHELIIRHGTVIDGTGADGVRADVAIDGERITAIGDLSADTATSARSTPPGSSSPPASSTCTPTSTHRWPGIRS